MVRGTFIERHLECARKSCRCHRSKKYRHGPYYFITIRKKNKSNHAYVPLKLMNEVRNWVDNYNRVWEDIKKITDINIRNSSPPSIIKIHITCPFQILQPVY